MQVEKTIRLGLDDNAQPDLIGRLVVIDHYRKGHEWTPNDVELRTYMGRIAHIVEVRGTANLAEGESIHDLDTSSFPDYETTIVFRSGSHVVIRENDAATISVYREED